MKFIYPAVFKKPKTAARNFPDLEGCFEKVTP